MGDKQITMRIMSKVGNLWFRIGTAILREGQPAELHFDSLPFGGVCRLVSDGGAL